MCTVGVCILLVCAYCWCVRTVGVCVLLVRVLLVCAYCWCVRTVGVCVLLVCAYCWCVRTVDACTVGVCALLVCAYCWCVRTVGVCVLLVCACAYYSWGASGVDPGFQIGGCPKCTRANFFFSATLTFKSTTRFGDLGIVTIGINKHEVVEVYNFEALCAHCC